MGNVFARFGSQTEMEENNVAILLQLGIKDTISKHRAGIENIR